MWLSRLARNLLIDHYRRTKLDRASSSIEEQLPMLEEKTASLGRTEGLLAGREASELLQAALQKLSPDLRETVILRDLEELEYREIAQVLNVPEGTVKSRLNRGRAELARILQAKLQRNRCELRGCRNPAGRLRGRNTPRGGQKSALEAHLAGCAACAELARDAAAAVAFMERAAVVEAPPELVTRILFEMTAGPSRAVSSRRWSAASSAGGWSQFCSRDSPWGWR